MKGETETDGEREMRVFLLLFIGQLIIFTVMDVLMRERERAREWLGE